jgi:hypothetical protein
MFVPNGLNNLLIALKCAIKCGNSVPLNEKNHKPKTFFFISSRP